MTAFSLHFAQGVGMNLLSIESTSTELLVAGRDCSQHISTPELYESFHSPEEYRKGYGSNHA